MILQLHLDSLKWVKIAYLKMLHVIHLCNTLNSLKYLQPSITVNFIKIIMDNVDFLK